MAIALPFGDLLGGAGGLAGLTSLTSLGGLGGEGGLPGLDVVSGLTGGGLPGLDLLSGGGDDGGLPLVGGLLGGGLPLPGLGGGDAAATGGVGAINANSGPVGDLLNQLEDATFGVPILGEAVAGIVGNGIEGGSLAGFLVTPLYGTPLFGPAQGLLGGNSVGEEILLYELATRPVAFTEGIPVVNDLLRTALLGDLAGPTALIGAYTGGLLSEDYLQFLVTEQGTLGALANSTDGIFSGLPLLGELIGPGQLNSALDLITNATDGILYVDDIVAGLGGGDALSDTLPFHGVLEATGLGAASAGILAPVGDLLLPALEPITSLIQEVPIAGPTILGNIGDFL